MNDIRSQYENEMDRRAKKMKEKRTHHTCEKVLERERERDVCLLVCAHTSQRLKVRVKKDIQSKLRSSKENM